MAAAAISVAVLAPELRQQFGLSLGETGVTLAAFGIGMTPTLLPWGLLTDRIGERVVLPLGLSTSAISLGCVGIASGFAQLVLLLVAAGALGASVNAASGRAVMHWFAPSERGLALGIRQANVPLGGLVAALTLPPLADSAGLGWAFAALAGTCLAAALAGAALLREPAVVPVIQAHTPSPSRPLRDPALWLISSGSALIVVGQIATMSFTVLYLSEGRGFSTRDAALVYAAAQVLGGALRILLGHVSDRFGSRIVPLCRAALAVSGTLALVAVFAGSPNWVPVPCSRWRAGSACRGTGCRSSPPPRSRGLGRVAPGSGSSRRSSESPGSSRRSASRPSSRQRRGGSRSSWRPSSRWPAGR